MHPTTITELDRLIKELGNHKDEWAQLGLARKSSLLEAVGERLAAQAEGWVTIAADIKGVPLDSPLAGEEWASGPWATLVTINQTVETLRALAAGDDPPLDQSGLRTLPDGRLAARVFPPNLHDRLLFSGYSAEVWMQPGVTADNLSLHMAGFYRDAAPEGRASLVLGAGNIFSISPLDIIYKMYAEGQVCLLKLHPVTDALGPVFEATFAPLIDAGYLAFCHGGADVGEYLTRHEGIDTIHVTGGLKTHDAIVYGRDDDGRERKERNQPLTTKEVTSELGNVTPTIVVPGPWTDRDIAYQAQHIATQKLHNSGFNCVASQVLVMPGAWDRSGDLVDAVRDALQAAPPRPAYYPFAAERQAAFAGAYEGAETLGGEVPRTFITGLDPDADEYCFTTEAFAPVYSQTSLPGATTAEFLEGAVEFCNDKLWGTLAADIIIHPDTIKTLGPRLDELIGELRYGTVGVNAWDGVGFLLGLTPWGGYAGATDADPQSGIGVVHNTRLFDKPEKAVVYGPFRPFPRTLASGKVHLSPKPQWFVNNRQSHHVGRKITRFVADPKPWRLPSLFSSALRG